MTSTSTTVAGIVVVDVVFPSIDLEVVNSSIILDVFIDGVLAKENVDYTVSGSTVTFEPIENAVVTGSTASVDILIKYI